MTAKHDNPTQTKVHRWTQEQLSAYIDDNLTQPEKVRLESHLAECSQCAHDIQTLCQTIEWLRQMPIQPLPRSFMIPESEALAAGFSLDWLFPYLRAGAVAAALLLVFVLSADLFQTSFSTVRLAQGPAYKEQVVSATSVTTHEPVVPPAKGASKSELGNMPVEITDTPPGKTEGVFPSLGLMASAPPPEAEMLDKAAGEDNLAEREDGQMAYEERPADDELPPPSLENELFQEESKTAREADTDMASALLLQGSPDQALVDIAPQAVEESEEPVGAQLIAPPPLATSPVPVDRAAPAAPVPPLMPEEPPSGGTTGSIALSATPLATFVHVTPSSDIMSPPAPTGEVAWVQSTSPPVSTPPPRMREEHTVTPRQTSHRLLWRVIEVSLLLIFLVSVTGAWLLTRQRSGSKT